MVNGGLKSLTLSTMNPFRRGLRRQMQSGRQSRINQPNQCRPLPSEVVLARPIHGLLRNRPAVPAAEN
jgi:hypothetical protein